MIYSKTRMASLLLAFGVFFTLSCTHFDRSGSPESSQDYDQLLEQINSELEKDPDNIQLQTEKATILYNMAISIENPLNRKPYYSDLRNLADTQLFQSGETHPDVINVTTKAWATEQGEGVRILQQDRVNQSDEKFNSIIAHFKNAITINPDSLTTYNLLANTYYRHDKIADAISTLEIANSVSENENAELKEKLAYLYLEAGEIDKSTRLYKQLSEDSPNDTHLLHGLANAYIVNKQHYEAIEILRDLTDAYPTRYEYNETLASELYFALSNQLDNLISDQSNNPVSVDDKDSVFTVIEEIDSIFEDLKTKLPFTENQLVRSGAFYKNTAIKLGEIESSESERILTEIENKRIELLQKAMPVWERLFENHPENTGYIKSLYSIYLELGKDEEAESLQRSFNL
jgi:tetratricopeptide (TPR) repeat protein